MSVKRVLLALEMPRGKVFSTYNVANTDMHTNDVNTQSTSLIRLIINFSFKDRVKAFKEAEKAKKENLSAE